MEEKYPIDGLANLNAYLSQNPVAVGNEPLTNVKNVDGLCVLIQLMEQENPVEKQGNAGANKKYSQCSFAREK